MCLSGPLATCFVTTFTREPAKNPSGFHHGRGSNLQQEKASQLLECYLRMEQIC